MEAVIQHIRIPIPKIFAINNTAQNTNPPGWGIGGIVPSRESARRKRDS
jgi:hypothetical protein